MLRSSIYRGNLLRKYLNKKVKCFATVTSYRHCPGEQPLRFRTVGNLVDEAAERFGDRTALVAFHQNKRISFGEVKEKAEQFAAGVLELGVQKGDRVAIWAPNSWEWYIANVALAKCGALSVHINPAYQGQELEHCLNKVGVKMLITPRSFKRQNYYEILKGLSPEIQSCSPGKLESKIFPKLETVVIISDESTPGCFRFTDIFEKGTESSRAKLREIEKITEPEEPTNIQFTSGTTGKPKAAILSHFAIVNNSLLISSGQQFHLKHHKLCLMGPFFHAMGSVIGILTALHHGTTMVIPDYIFNPDNAVESIVQEKCTAVLGTPTMYVDIFRKIKEKNIKLSSLEVAICGGALCSPDLYREMMDVLGLKRTAWVYGLTESGPVAFMTHPTDGPDKVTTTVGRLMPHTEAKVVDASGATLPCNSPGELLLRGFLLMEGYWDDEEKTTEVLTPNHWLRTGDQFIIDENGYGKIVGRIKDLIIRGGENISPLEVEEFLLNHPDALEVQVFGIPDKRLGEEVCACLTLRPGSKLTENELKEFCKGKISHFKIPSHVYFMDEFPKTASGKIQRFKLKEKVMKIIEGGS